MIIFDVSDIEAFDMTVNPICEVRGVLLASTKKQGLGYKYDPIGNLIIDEWEDLYLSWYVNGKVREVTRGAAVEDLPDIAFTYDGTGRRTTKLLRTRTGTELDKDTYWSNTYYFRDAQGNVMAVYKRRWNGQVAGGYSYSDMLTLTEQHLYGSDRLGVRRPDLDAASRPYTITGANGPITIKEYGPETTTAHPNPDRATYDLGRNRYELTNHPSSSLRAGLGNVLATVSDNVGHLAGGNLAGLRGGREVGDGLLRVWDGDAGEGVTLLPP